jgi:predicted nuclease of predicted toxin-antitoxin system
VRFLVDECTGPAVASWLRSQSHEVFSVYDEARGASDDEVLAKAAADNWILITNDKDFGEKIFREKQVHHGTILLRLDDERARSKLAAIEKLLRLHADRLTDRFVVVTETRVRFARS